MLGRKAVREVVEGGEVTVFKTFDRWSNEGFLIIRGSKATWINGTLMFSHLQVKKKPKSRVRGGRCYYGDYYDGLDRDEMEAMGEDMGGPFY